MKKVKLSYTEIAGLHSVLKELSDKPLPMKFAIARNFTALEEANAKYQSEKEALHMKYVVVSDGGMAIVKQQFREHIDKMQAIPYQWFEYNSLEEEKELLDKLFKLGKQEVELSLTQEDLQRTVKIKSNGSYESLTLQEALDDPSADINADAISVLLKYEILK